MSLAKKKKTLAFFCLIFAVFAALLFYLAFFNAGLEISMETNENQVKFFLQNNSMHLIRDSLVSIKRANGETQPLVQIAELNPKEKIELNMPFIEKEQIKIIASAPFHVTISREASIERSMSAKLRIEVTLKDSVPVGTGFTASLRVCNDAATIDNLKIAEVHIADFFEEAPKVQLISLPEGECRRIDFRLTPKKAGETTIYFKLQAINISQEMERAIAITEN